MPQARRPLDRAQAGASLTIPFIIVVILMLGAFGLWWVANEDVSRFMERERQARADLAAKDASLEATIKDYQALSNLVGFRNENNLASKSEPAAITQAIESVKAGAGSALGSDDVTLEDAVGALQQRLASREQAISQMQSDLTTAQAAVQTALSSTESVRGTLQQQLDSLQQQLADEQARSDSQSKSDQQRFDGLLASEQTKDSQLRQVQRELADAAAAARRQMSTAEATIRTLKQQHVEAAPDSPDGEVLSVSGSGELAYIDIGGRDGLRVGTRFDVLRSGKGGELRPMGRLQVREVEGDMALAGVLGGIDPYDPILPGDVVRNPHFERGLKQHFFLLGEFPLTMSHDFVAQRLAELGGVVDDQVTANTDILVLGHESLAEGEFAQPLAQSDEFILADKLGVQVMKLDDLADYLRY